MSTDRDTTRIVRSWLEHGVTALPDRVLDLVLDELPATPQHRHSRAVWRYQRMNSLLKMALAAAAAVILAVVGFNLMPRSGGVGGLPPTPAPPTAVAPTPSPTPAPILPASGPVAPGTFRTDLITYTVPAGWTAQDNWGIYKVTTDPPNGMQISPWHIAKVYQDPCRSISIPAVAVGPTVDDLVAALAGQKRHGQIVTPVDVTIDGYHGKQIDLMVPLNVVFASSSNASTCEGGQYLSWEDPTDGQRWNQGPGQHDLLQILDVNGRRLVIKESFFPANTAADRAELQAIVDSITITP